jgi:amidase
MMDELAHWDAIETVQRLERRDVSVKEVVEAAVARAEAKRALGALVTPTFERAFELAKGIPPRGRFAGVPSAIKDLAQVKGVRTTFGSRGAATQPPAKSDPWVQAYEGLGFISLGKSATPELGLTATTEPLGFEPCRNPWDPERSTGGSSGGAAALVAAGVVPIAHASDGGGSIRIPAGACGVVGLKPTRGRFDMEGSNLLPINVAVHGVVSRTVRDTVAFWDALSTVAPRPKLHPVTPVGRAPARPLRVGFYVQTPKATPVAAEHVQAVKDTAKKLEVLGHHVEEIPTPADEQFADDFTTYWSFVAWAQSRTMALLAQKGFQRLHLDPWTEGLARSFASARVAGLGAIMRLRSFPQRFLASFQRFDVLLSPTLAHLPPKLGHLAPHVEWGLQLSRLTEWVPFTQAYNVSGAPAISLPLSRSAEGLPISVQLGADRGNERTLLELATQLEGAFPWPKLAPARA